MLKSDLFKHQVRAVEISQQLDKLLICDQMGLGKSLEAIAIAIDKRDRGLISKCLVICGVNATKYNWQKEIYEHTYDGCSLVDGKGAERLSIIEDWESNDNFFLVVNIEAFRQSNILERLLKIDIGMVVIDEIHKCKNSNSLQGRLIHLFKSKYKIGLTGTPIQNKPIDIYNILKWLDIEKRNFYAFRARYCIMNEFKSIVGFKNLNEVHDILHKIMIRRLKKDVIDLPDKLYSVEYVDLSDKQRILYRQSKEGILMMFKEGINIPSNPLTTLLILRKITGGLLTKENPKAERLKEILEEIGDKKVIVFTNYKEVGKVLINLFPKSLYIDGDVPVIDRQRIVEEFQTDPRKSLLIGTVGAMGTGLTLNKAEYVIFFDKDYSPSNNAQAEDRAHRIGQKNNVNIISLVTKATIDERIEKMLLDKQVNIDFIVNNKANKSSLDLIDYLLK